MNEDRHHGAHAGETQTALLTLRMPSGSTQRLSENAEHQGCDDRKPEHSQLSQKLQIVVVRKIDAKPGQRNIELLECRLVATETAAEERVCLDETQSVLPHEDAVFEREFPS